MIVRRLSGPRDALIFQAIRLEALKTEPTAYASRHADWVGQPPAEWERRLEATPTWAVFHNDAPVGMMGYRRESSSKMAHRASLVMVYIREDMRKTGVADQLLKHVLAGAGPDGIDQMELAVATANTAAVRFYERNGFRIVGTIPRGFRHDGQDIDEHIMVRSLRA